MCDLIYPVKTDATILKDIMTTYNTAKNNDADGKAPKTLGVCPYKLNPSETEPLPEMITCLRKENVREKYECYKEGFGGGKDTNYCNLIYNDTEGFFKCLDVHPSILTADWAYMYQYRKNDLKHLLEVVNDPMVMYNQYKANGIKSTSYDCKGAV